MNTSLLDKFQTSDDLRNQVSYLEFTTRWSSSLWANSNDNKSNMKFSMNLNVPTKLDFKLSSWFLWEAQQISPILWLHHFQEQTFHVYQVPRSWNIVLTTVRFQQHCSKVMLSWSLGFLPEITQCLHLICGIKMWSLIVDCCSGNQMQIETKFELRTQI